MEKVSRAALLEFIEAKERDLNTCMDLLIVMSRTRSLGNEGRTLLDLLDDMRGDLTFAHMALTMDRPLQEVLVDYANCFTVLKKYEFK